MHTNTTTAVVGVMLNLAIWFAIHTIFRETFPVHAMLMDFDAPKLTSIDLRAFGLAAAAAVAISRFKIGMIPTLAACIIAGITFFLIGLLR